MVFRQKPFICSAAFFRAPLFASLLIALSFAFANVPSASAQMASTQMASAQAPMFGYSVLLGTDSGLYGREQNGRIENLWPGGKVKMIAQKGSGWALLSERGVWVSENLRDWEQRSAGLPQRVIKSYEGGKKSFENAIQDIKSFAVDGENMVCVFKDAVYLSRNGGRNWQSIGTPNNRSSGLKAAAVFTPPGGELTVICSHNIYGAYYINPLRAAARWTELNSGLEKLETTDNPDEISSFALVQDPLGNNFPSVYAAQSFRRRLYKLDWNRKSWEPLWSDGLAFGAMDSIAAGRNAVRFVQDGGISEIALSPPNQGRETRRNDLVNLVKNAAGNMKPNCAVVRLPPETTSPYGPPVQQMELVSLSELWLLDDVRPVRPRGTGGQAALNKEGIYLPVNHAMEPYSLRPYLELIEKRKLNMVVIDMKDDYGRLRFAPQNASLNLLGRVFRPIDLEVFIKTMKERGIYTVARIVVFKDPEAAARSGGRYAVWDGANNKPWEGYYDTRRKKAAPGQEYETNSALTTAILPAEDSEYEILRTWYDEKWVDPYSEEIWEYNARLAEELVQRGFDEIQFDYIRFPTDGLNLSDARYRWRDSGMDMDSAIISFLRHVRSLVKAPISVDIYGANGWYRTGARTGQEVELLAPLVDIICPMYYPSHFEQYFLAQDPPELRPFRIYYQGTLRTHYIARGEVIVRPWAQAFYLNVSYDRRYYGPEYVSLQTNGVRAISRGGLTYWNNSGRYDDVPE